MGPGLHRFVIPLPLPVARTHWDQLTEPWMAPVELAHLGPARTVATVRPEHEDHAGYEAAFRTAACLQQFLADTRQRRANQRRGEVMPPVGPVAGGSASRPAEV